MRKTALRQSWYFDFIIKIKKNNALAKKFRFIRSLSNDEAAYKWRTMNFSLLYSQYHWRLNVASIDFSVIGIRTDQKPDFCFGLQVLLERHSSFWQAQQLAHLTTGMHSAQRMSSWDASARYPRGVTFPMVHDSRARHGMEMVLVSRYATESQVQWGSEEEPLLH